MRELDIKAMIFDLDGTLIKFALDVKSVRREAIAEIRKRGMNVENLSKLSVYSMLKVMKRRTDGRTLLNLKQSLWRIVEKFELKAAYEVCIQPDALQTIAFIKKLGFKLAIVTNNGRKATNIVIRKLGLEIFFDVIVTREDVEELKPDGWSIGRTIKILGIEARETVYVGDSVIDVLAAKNARVISVAVPTGISSIRDLIKAEPDYIICSLKDIEVLLNTPLHN
ncbi:MAG: HAD family hydrolase [Candidatus Methylarchaceae archaeon HK01M]|nr:HAD family hydrolase [Candidatus Methylarchaceae archaeon HK01M]